MANIKPNQALGALVIVTGLWLVVETGTNAPVYGFSLVLVGGGLLLGKGAFLKVVDVVTSSEEAVDVELDATTGDGDGDTGGSGDGSSDGEAVAEGQASN